MGLFKKIKDAKEAVTRELQEPLKFNISKDAARKEEQIECPSFAMLRDEEKLKVLRLIKDFDLSTQELIDKGFADRYVYRFHTAYKYGVKLVPEPSNPYDSNALKITINGKKAGYVPRGEAPRIKSMMDMGKISAVRFDVMGGPARKIFKDGTSMALCFDYNPVLTITYF